jgi:hypothetical protein
MIAHFSKTLGTPIHLPNIYLWDWYQTGRSLGYHSLKKNGEFSTAT